MNDPFSSAVFTALTCFRTDCISSASSLGNLRARLVNASFWKNSTRRIRSNPSTMCPTNVLKANVIGIGSNFSGMTRTLNSLVSIFGLWNSTTYGHSSPTNLKADIPKRCISLVHCSKDMAIPSSNDGMDDFPAIPNIDSNGSSVIYFDLQSAAREEVDGGDGAGRIESLEKPVIRSISREWSGG